MQHRARAFRAEKGSGISSCTHALSPTTVMQLPALMLERVQRDPVLASHFRGEGSLGIQNGMLKAVLAELSVEDRLLSGLPGEEALLIDDFREREVQAGLTSDDVMRWGGHLVDSLREAGVDERECRMAHRAVVRILDQTEWRDHLDDAIRAMETPGAVDKAAVLRHLYAVRHQLASPGRAARA